MKNTALIIIDVQNGMFLEENPVFKWEKIILNLKQLIDNARINKIPIFYIQHNAPIGSILERGSEAWEIRPEVTPAPTDIIIQKTTPDSFHNTNLYAELKHQNIEHLVLTGIQSEVCVDTTCRKAFSLGFAITLVTDAHSTWNTSELSAQQIINHHNQVLRWFAETKETEDILFKNEVSIQ
ncbi:cysteine hydrolase [Viridibacillus sp. YIM B01967]|uniref:Cysteine hydrolase n=1 Tax=Viridibacillus soli TaxID=2798301 RepID=A0ABS1HAH2_9BACL|nr:cysteine hydrolase family protein [Viridibacillus soli]MBK3496433.1 cysteine hydrolase [Viridibacillus soli]